MDAPIPGTGIVGIGSIGLPFAAKLLHAGYPVTGTDRGRVAELVEMGGKVPDGATPRAVGQGSDVVFTCLPSAKALSEVVSGQEGILHSDPLPRVVVDLGTTEVKTLERESQVLEERGCQFLSCPVSGTPAMVDGGKATAFASGDEQVFESIADVIRAGIPNTTYVGQLGSGMYFKFVANLLVAVHCAAAAEAIALAGFAGLDRELLVQLISASPGATSGQFNVRAPMMASREFERLASVDLLCKDLKQIEAFADAAGARTPTFSAAKRLFEEMSARGDGDEDAARLSVMLEEGMHGDDRDRSENDEQS